MDQHIIELSNRYQLTVGDRGFVIYQLELNPAGAWKRAKAQYCTNFDAVIETLTKCELNQEDVLSLQDCYKTLKAIHAEVAEIKAHLYQ